MAENSQNDNVAKYKSGFTGTVPKEFTQPPSFVIKHVVRPTGKAAEAYGYKGQESHPTPTDPLNPAK